MDDEVFAPQLKDFTQKFGKKDSSSKKPEEQESECWLFKNSEFNEYLDTPLDEWTYKQVFWFFQHKYYEVYQVDPHPDYTRDLSIVKSFVTRWGVVDSYRIIKYFFEEKRGLYDKQRQSIHLLSKGADWIIQILYSEMNVKNESDTYYETDTYLSSSDFREAFQ